MPSTTVPATVGWGAVDAVSVGVMVSAGVGSVVGVGVGVGVDEVGLETGGLGAPPLSSEEEHPTRAASEAPAPPRSITRLVARTPM
jgi:hypothetical protein